MNKKHVIVKPNARQSAVSVSPDGQLVVAVRASAGDGKANQELIAVFRDPSPAFRWSKVTPVVIK